MADGSPDFCVVFLIPRPCTTVIKAAQRSRASEIEAFEYRYEVIFAERLRPVETGSHGKDMAKLVAVFMYGAKQSGAEVEFPDFQITAKRPSDVTVAGFKIPTIDRTDHRSIDPPVPIQVEIDGAVGGLSGTVDHDRRGRHRHVIN